MVITLINERHVVEHRMVSVLACFGSTTARCTFYQSGPEFENIIKHSRSGDPAMQPGRLCKDDWTGRKERVACGFDGKGSAAGGAGAAGNRLRRVPTLLQWLRHLTSDLSQVPDALEIDDASPTSRSFLPRPSSTFVRCGLGSLIEDPGFCTAASLTILARRPLEQCFCH